VLLRLAVVATLPSLSVLLVLLQRALSQAQVTITTDITGASLADRSPGLSAVPHRLAASEASKAEDLAADSRRPLVALAVRVLAALSLLEALTAVAVSVEDFRDSPVHHLLPPRLVRLAVQAHSVAPALVTAHLLSVTRAGALQLSALQAPTHQPLAAIRPLHLPPLTTRSSLSPRFRPVASHLRLALSRPLAFRLRSRSHPVASLLARSRLAEHLSRLPDHPLALLLRAGVTSRRARVRRLLGLLRLTGKLSIVLL